MSQVSSFFDSSRVIGLLKSSEYKPRGMWLTGTMAADPSVAFELSFEDDNGTLRPLPGTRITCLNMWRGKATLFEYFNGLILNKPSELDYVSYVNPLMVRLGHYRPMFVYL